MKVPDVYVPKANASDDSFDSLLHRPKGSLLAVDPAHLEFVLIKVMRLLADRKKLDVVTWARDSKRNAQTVRNVLKEDRKETPRKTLESMANALECHLYELERFCTLLLLSGVVRVVETHSTGKLRLSYSVS